jgi:hypothetical protein
MPVRKCLSIGGAIAASGLSCAVTTMAAAGAPAEVLLIPNSQTKHVMAYSADDGTLLDAQFIPNPGSIDGLTLNRPLHAIDSGRGTILLGDQLRHVVFEFEFDGTPIRVFAPAGGQNTSVLNNIRGLAILPGGDLLVSNAGTGIVVTANSIMRFDEDGEQGPSFIFQRYGGIRGPFDVLVLEDMILVSAEHPQGIVARYTPEGKFDELFARNHAFPMQLAESSTGTILLAVSSGGYIAEFARDGTLIGQYSAGLSGFRGVHELNNGNLLVTNGTGVHEITRANQLVGTKFTGTEMRYIERVTLPGEAATAGRHAVNALTEIDDRRPLAASRDRSIRRSTSREAASGGQPSTNGPWDIYIIEDSGYFGVPGVTAGVVGRISADNPGDVTILGDAGGHLAPFNWGGIDFRPPHTTNDPFQLFGFENLTNSVRKVHVDQNTNELIDSVGFIESGGFVSGFAIDNDGNTGYAAGTVSFQGRIVKHDLATGAVLSVHGFNNFHSISSIAVVPEGTELPYEAGTIFGLRNISGGAQLVQYDLDTNTATSHGSVTGLGFTAAFESGLDFAPDGTLYAAIQGVSGGNDVSSRLFTIDPANAAATLIGIIGNDNTWDVAGIAVVPKPSGVVGDLNGDGVVDVLDLLILLDSWGQCKDPGECPADLNGDGAVDVLDLLILLDNWG